MDEGADLSTFCAVLERPQDLDRMAKYVIAVGDSAAEMANVVDCNTAYMLVKRQFALMAELCPRCTMG